jgi:hypothetical protein
LLSVIENCDAPLQTRVTSAWITSPSTSSEIIAPGSAPAVNVFGNVLNRNPGTKYVLTTGLGEADWFMAV